ncbi:MAG: Na+:solute symporter [Acidobacteria bacterium]|nr:Na+:solute symporter [Acidobacteriota bacterium]
MQLSSLDWFVVASYGVIALATGLYFARRAGTGMQEFFLSGRKLPWWLLGTSMVATTFSTDTPNLVTDIVRTGGVSGNWLWWAFLVTGMCTVFFYAKLWRRSGVLTDMGFYELRYSGKPAAFLRAFRALYLGVFFNVLIMATVTLAAIKISGVLLGIDKYTTVLVAATVTAAYSATSGLWGVVVTDLLLFTVSMVGSLAAAYFALQRPEVGGLSGLISSPALQGKLSLLPDFSDWTAVSSVLIVPLAVQWWSTWYPGAEPGGGGYVAQRMLAARNEKEAAYSTLWFNIAHYALRPWPWILVALCSVLVYPTLGSLQQRFPDLDPTIIGHDLAYPAMLVFLPSGLLGLVVASLAAAYMSTISTHLNWGASYMVDDCYKRFWAPDRSDTHYVLVARLSTVILVVLASVVALWLENALQAFQILLQIGAGTGLIFLLRWYWWRINVWGEVAAMVISFSVAVYFEAFHVQFGFAELSASAQLVMGVVITTAGWVLVTFLTPPTDEDTLRTFYAKIRPLGSGWRPVVESMRRSGIAATGELVAEGVSAAAGESLTAAFLAWFLGCVTVYAALFGTGYFLYGELVPGIVCLFLFVVAAGWLSRVLPRVGFVD